MISNLAEKLGKFQEDKYDDGKNKRKIQWKF